MEDIAGSAVAGLIAAVAATIILGVAKWVYQKHLQQLDINQIHEVLTDGRRRVLEAKKTFNHDMNATLPGDMLRAAKYNHDQAVKGCLGPYDIEPVLRQKEGDIRRA